MKRLLIGLVTAGLVLTGATTVIAATFKTPAEIYAELKGITVEEAYSQKAGGTSYGALAKDAGVLEDFQARMLENRKAVIQDRVAQGKLTQEQADTMIQNMEQNMVNCDGTALGSCGSNMGQGMGGFGKGMGGFGKGRGMAGGGCFGNSAEVTK